MGKSLKGKELGRGITQRRDGLYQASFVNRFGKRQTMYSKTYNDISKKLREAKYEDDHLLTPARPDMTLDEWFDIWVSTCKKNCRDTTLRTYKINYNQLKGELGWRKLKDLNLVILQGAMNELSSDQSRRNCKGESRA